MRYLYDGRCDVCGIVQDLWDDEAPHCIVCDALDSVKVINDEPTECEEE